MAGSVQITSSKKFALKKTKPTKRMCNQDLWFPLSWTGFTVQDFSFTEWIILIMHQLFMAQILQAVESAIQFPLKTATQKPNTCSFHTMHKHRTMYTIRNIKQKDNNHKHKSSWTWSAEAAGEVGWCLTTGSFLKEDFSWGMKAEYLCWDNILKESSRPVVFDTKGHLTNKFCTNSWDKGVSHY